jgi:hypothetical protein
MSGHVRLAELWERACKETQARNAELESQLEHDQHKSAEEVARWQSQTQEEVARFVEAENRIRELEDEVERLEAIVETNAAGVLSPIGLNGNRQSTPTSNRGALASPLSGSGIFSPSAQQLEKRGRSGMSLTQLVSELHASRQAETLQRRRAERIQEEYTQ